MTKDISLRPWIRTTFLGWLLGIALVIGIALIGEVVGVHGSQLVVGLGMGLGVGFAQERALRPLLGASQSWRWATTLGLSAPFLLFDLARVIGLGIPFSLYIAVAVAGVTVGLAQARLLKPHGIESLPWVLASFAGWTCAALTSALADSMTRWSTIRGLPGALLYLGLVGLGGILLGLVTSVPLRKLATPNTSARG